jgi:hypothetical protein
MVWSFVFRTHGMKGKKKLGQKAGETSILKSQYLMTDVLRGDINETLGWSWCSCGWICVDRRDCLQWR